MSTAPVFGLVHLKGKPEEFQRLAKHWLERDDQFHDLRFLLEKGGEDWLFNGLMTGPSQGINPSSIQDRLDLYGSNKRKRLSPPCSFKVTQLGGSC